MRSGSEAVEVESLEMAVVSSLVVKEEQKVLWRDGSEHWSKRRSFHEVTLSTTRESGSLLREVWAEVGNVDVGSIFRRLRVRKFWIARRTLLASNCVKKVENSTGFEQGGNRLLQVACEVSVLALELTEDVLRDASTYAIRWATERYASERALHLSRTADSASSDHHALGGRPRQPKGMEALAAFKRSDKKDRAAQWIFCASSIGRGSAQRYILQIHPNEPLWSWRLGLEY